MYASDVVAQLQKLINQHGDLEVVDEYDNEMDPVEYSTDGDSPAFVVAFSD